MDYVSVGSSLFCVLVSYEICLLVGSEIRTNQRVFPMQREQSVST